MRTNDLAEVNFNLGLEQWEKLYLKYSASVMNLAYSILKNSYLSEHILRKVFIKAKFYLDYDTDENTAKIWLMILTITLSENEKKSKKILDSINKDIELYNYADFYPKYEENAFINKVLTALSEIEGQAIVLNIVNDIKIEEINEILAKSPVKFNKVYKSAASKLENLFKKDFPTGKEPIETLIFTKLKNEMKINPKFYDYNKETIRQAKSDISKDENLEIYEISYEKRNKIIRYIVIAVILIVLIANFKTIRVFFYNWKLILFPYNFPSETSKASSGTSSLISSLTGSSGNAGSNYLSAQSFYFTSDQIDAAIERSGNILKQPSYIAPNLGLDSIKITMAQDETGVESCIFTELTYVDNSNPLEVRTFEVKKYLDKSIKLTEVTEGYDRITLGDNYYYQKVLQEQTAIETAWNIYYEKNEEVVQVTAYYLPYSEVINMINGIE